MVGLLSSQGGYLGLCKTIDNTGTGSKDLPENPNPASQVQPIFQFSMF